MTDRVEPPNLEEIERLARLEGIPLEAGEAVDLAPVVATLTDFEGVPDRLGGLLDLPVGPQRDPGWVPRPEQNPYNAFVRRCRVEGSPAGRLSGLTIGLKDNISLAGVPTTNGSRVSAVTPVHDAVVVERILAEGGTIVGKLNMDDFGSSGLGETSAFGPARNPADPTRSAGARPAARGRPWRRVRSTSRSVSTRAGAGAFPALSVASSPSRRPTGSSRRGESATSTTRSTTSRRSPARSRARRCCSR